MDIFEPEILDVKYLMSGEEDFSFPLTPERNFWWFFWAAWLHDAYFCKWGKKSSSHSFDVLDNEDYYESLFGEESRAEILEMLDFLVDDSIGILKKWKRYIDGLPDAREIFERLRNVEIPVGQLSQVEVSPIKRDYRKQKRKPHLVHYPRKW